ncbi:hypothetical protein [Hoylesella loescheii]|uniref:Uncharacterized protein n=1 Tax=Hoylesella loescheii DSM 19665 = JCM 12249 = ATCC 15930 TaxID=1122985 RepID=A0A069QLI4_HOYLO|nr:hypothetical protein [Hoylesella loescheii]KDR50666.1 hypothetical protein HMPREF1991_03274 [Hoylesella loescheii DSM 19665 = JCM 12249 = ATCC 15930]
MSGKAFNSFAYDLSASVPLSKTGAKVIVQFRTSGSYKGKYGFDRIRMGDSGRPGDTWYANIMGNKHTSKNEVIVDKTMRVYDYYASRMFSTKRFVIPWKTQGKRPFMYISPVMTLRKGASAKLTLKVEVKEPAVKMEYQCQTSGIFQLSKDTIPTLGKGKHTLPDELVVTCLKEFSRDQDIKVYAYDEDNVKHLAGKLIVKANDKKHQRTINVAVVRVLFKEKETFPDISSSVTKLRNILGQAYVKIDDHTVSLNIEQALTNKETSKYFTPKGWIHSSSLSSGDLYSFLNAELSKKFPKFNKYFKLYYINRKCVDDTSGKEMPLYGRARNLFSLEVIISFNGLNDNTAVHELLHCIGLPHSFSKISVSYFDVAFKNDLTDNIMDYSDMHSGIPTIATWEYQWRAIQNSITHLQAGKW